MRADSKKDTKISRAKEMILASEEKKEFSSEIFATISAKIKADIGSAHADTALEDITMGSLNLWSSDIHYEVREDDIIIRFRIDGILADVMVLSKQEYKLMLERLKYAAGLKLNLTDIPQDGKYSLKLSDKKIDVRVSILPTKYGENVVCRVLDASKAIIDFEKLGFFWTSKRIIEKAIAKKSGMILVTGPTGSGKTTTLYTMLSKLNTRDKKMITIEDPVEYELPGVIQSEVDESKWFSFASWLRAMLRQDPDVIMVGEIRWSETLETATAASLTGHLVLSTLHTKSAAETLDRLLNMGMKPYIMASALDTIIAQRLVRKLCDHCKLERDKTSIESQIISDMMQEIGMKSISVESLKLYKPGECDQCGHTWYKWRIGLFEIISLDDDIRELIRSAAPVSKIIKSARNKDFISMKEDWILKAMRGYTTIEEILRVL